jgi:putative nucleotidyltransferase with HDIG domain
VWRSAAMFNITQRQAALVLLTIQFLAPFVIFIFEVFNAPADVPVTAAVVWIYGILFLLYWRGWDPARHLAVILFTLIVGFILPEPFVTKYAPLLIVIPLIMALVLTGPLGVPANAVVLLIILLARAGFQGVYSHPVTLTLYFMVVSGLMLSRLIVETSRRQAEQQAKELILAYDATIEGWSHALDLRDKETEGHTQRVAQVTLRLARAMNVSEEQLVQIRRGALLHDIGKMGVPDDILHKAGFLTNEEWVIMRKHPVYAYEMLCPIPFLQHALDIPYSHHEKWDGSGYPHGLKGEEIPLAARIFAVVDVWDALRSDRPYRKSWPEERVREYIRTESGKHFDPRVVDAFLALLKEEMEIRPKDTA